MATNFGNNVNFNNYEIQNILLQKLAADPTNVTAKIYYNTVSNTIKYYNGSSWQTVGTGVGSGDVVGPASSVDNELVLFNGTTGKLIKAATLTGLIKATSGVVSAASAGTDYLAPAAIGTTVQAYDATLAALASYSTNGIVTQTAADTFTGRTITGTANEISVADGNGVAGNPTLSLPTALTFTGKTVTGGTFTTPTINVNANVLSIRDNTDTSKVLQFSVAGVTTATTRTLTVPNASGTIALTSDLSGYQTADPTLTALAGLDATAGVVVQTAADTFTKRTLTGTANRISITNGTGASGNPTFDIGSDVVTNSSTHTLTNKTFDANGTGNSISNIETADLASGVLNTSTTLTGASNTQIPSALAVKTYIDNSFGAVDAFVYKGGIDASTNPNYPAASAGDVYKITVAGKIGGASGPDVQIGDTLYCTVDASAAGNHATVGTNWTIVQANVDRATDTTLGLAEYATQAEAEAKTSALVALTPASIANFPQKKTFTIGDGAATSFALTHNLNTQDIVVSVRKVSTNEQWMTSTTCNSVNQVTLTFATAPTNNEFVVTVIG